MSLIAVVLCAAPISLVRIPDGSIPTRTHVDEAPLAQQGVGLATQAGMLASARAPALRKSLDEAYRQLIAERGEFPTPAIGTLADQQSSKGFDLVLVPPLGQERPDTAAIFLHGWGGNATLECWLAARALGQAGLLTACPSVGLDAQWDSKDGRSVVEQTRAFLAKRGKKRFLLVGLSSGAVGAAQLASRDETAWAALACLEGSASLPTTIPVLLLTASQDQFTSPELARRLARGHHNVRVEQLEGDHFAALEHRDQLADILTDFVRHTLR